jgi:hypothetical protein
MFRSIVFLVNLGVGAWMVWAWLTRSWNSPYEGFHVFSVLPLSTALFLIWPGELFSLWLKRRSFEEQKRIEELSEGQSSRV